MRFWDTSACVCLLVDQEGTEKATSWHKKNPGIWAWWGTAIEAASAICRLERDGFLDRAKFAGAMARLKELSETWSEVQPTPMVRETAIRYLRVHNLRASDALQLAAAHIAAEQRPSSLEFVCLDKRLSMAASKEGFQVLPVP